jgi:hypothetical protein
MADKKVSELSAITNLSGDDLLLVVNDPSGTPTSNKITVGNVFANVAVQSTFKANTVFSGNRMTISANVVLNGTNITSLFEDRMQVANVTSTYVTNATFQSVLSNTNSAISDRFQVSNAFSTFANSADPIFTGTATADTLNTNFMTIINPKGLLLVGGGVTTQVPATSNTASEDINVGTFWYSNNYLYIAVDSNTIKRIELESF